MLGIPAVADFAFACVSLVLGIPAMGQVKMFADFAFEVIPSAHLAISTHDEKGHKKAIIKATEPTDTICLVFKAIGTCRKSKHHTPQKYDQDHPKRCTDRWVSGPVGGQAAVVCYRSNRCGNYFPPTDRLPYRRNVSKI